MNRRRHQSGQGGRRQTRHRRGDQRQADVSGRRRDETSIYLGGPHAVAAALDAVGHAAGASDRPLAVAAVDRLCVDAIERSAGGAEAVTRRTAELLQRARELGIPVSRVAVGECDRLAGVRAQGVAVEVRYAYADFDDALADLRETTAGVLVFLDGIEDPHNLGAIIRTAEAVGVRAVIIPNRRSASVTPAVVRASAGAAVSQPVCRVGNMVQALQAARNAGIWIVGLDQDGTSLLEPAAPGRPYGLVIGGEGHGLGRLVGENCDEIASLPMRGSVESLNASVAASVALYRLCESSLFPKRDC